ncbi:MAG: ATP-dependent RecD-like DNA helicase [Polyangiaceae bacterium]
MKLDSVGETTIEGEVTRVTFENPTTGFRVVKMTTADRKEPIAVVGAFPAVGVGARIRVRGAVERDKTHGEQIRAVSVTELQPSTLVGIERYLGSGLVKGVGPKVAARIVETFGLDTLRVLDESPAQLSRVPGLGKKRAETIAVAWIEQRTVRDVMIFLQAHGASVSLATRIAKRYGARAMHIVSREPYRLALDVWGVGFRTADRIAMELGVAKDSVERVRAGIVQVLHDETNHGHVFVPADLLFEKARALLEIDESGAGTRDALRAACLSLAIDGRLVWSPQGDPETIFEAGLHRAELDVAKRIVEMARAPRERLRGAEVAIERFERAGGVALADEQRYAVELASNEPFLVITGGPGVGKTTIVRAVVSVFESAGLTVRLAAPTGRAAKRLSESTSREALTLHRLLEFDPKQGGFKRDAHAPLEGHALVVDEASMVDLPLADALLRAIPPGMRVVFVGDVDQLPSVGPGSVLSDLIGSERIPVVRLTKIFRQAEASLIVTNAHRIHRGEAPVSAPAGDTSADFFVVERKDPESARDTVVELVTTRIPKRFGLDPVRDVQVLVPMHRGASGTQALNEALQSALNPHGAVATKGNKSFRVGDKVMQLRNDYDRNVANGDIGRVTRMDAEEETLTVTFEDGGSAGEGGSRDVVYEPSNLDELTLAYACSVHKSQGSEYPAVVIPFLTSHFVMLSKNLLYTAVTRGKRLVVLVSDSRALSLALSGARQEIRRTRLATRIREAFDDGPVDGGAGHRQAGGESC